MLGSVAIIFVYLVALTFFLCYSDFEKDEFRGSDISVVMHNGSDQSSSSSGDTGKERNQDLMWDVVYALWWMSWSHRSQEHQSRAVPLSLLTDHVLATRRRREVATGCSVPDVSEAKVAHTMIGAMQSGIAQMCAIEHRLAYIIHPGAAVAIQISIDSNADVAYRPGLPRPLPPELAPVYRRYKKEQPFVEENPRWGVPSDKLATLHNENLRWVTSFFSNAGPPQNISYIDAELQ